jgi:hypothetical protein
MGGPIGRVTSSYAGPHWYLFVSTGSLLTDERARNVASQLYLAPARAKRAGASRGAPDPIWMQVLNDLDKVTPGKTVMSSPPQNTHYAHSFSSLALSLDGEYSFLADFWGINTHYWSYDRDTFVASNNILAVARTVGAGLSARGVYEALFFNVPLSCSWFEGINCLRAGEKLTYDSVSHSTSQCLSPVGERLRSLPDKPPIESVNSYFEKACDCLSDCDCYIGLSAGSDSRTVLAAMRGKGLTVRAVSFGCCDYNETVLIRKFVQRYEIPWRLVDLDGFEDGWIPFMRKGVVETSGLLNASRLHYFRLYDSVPPGAPIFEGILGSEFVKAEIAQGSMVGECHHMVIVDGASVRESLTRVYPELPLDFCDAAAEHITETFPEVLLPIETGAGRLAFIEYALENIPRKVFSGTIQLGQKNHRMFFPFLSPQIVWSFFRGGQGLVRSNSLRSDFDLLRCTRPEAEIVRQMDASLYRSLLDRNITFEEAECCPRRLLTMKKKLRALMCRVLYRRHRHGQVDNSKLNALKRNRMLETGCDVDVLPVKVNEKSGYKLIDLLLNLHFLQGAAGAV